jgi:hypothetical protein
LAEPVARDSFAELEATWHELDVPWLESKGDSAPDWESKPLVLPDL